MTGLAPPPPRLSDLEPFVIGQIKSVELPGRIPDAAPLVSAYADVIGRVEGAVGFLAEEAPDGWFGRDTADAFLIAMDNRRS